MIVAQQKFLKEIFAELPKFCPKPPPGSGQSRTELCSGTGLHFDFCIFPPEEDPPLEENFFVPGVGRPELIYVVRGEPTPKTFFKRKFLVFCFCVVLCPGWDSNPHAE
jgi:hypothetical protein